MEVSSKVMDFLIVDDHEMFGQLLQGVLNDILGLYVVALARSVREGISACEKFKPQGMILDLGLPDGDGVTVAQEAVKHNPLVKIIVLSGHATTFACPRIIQPAIHAILDKKRNFQLLDARVRELVSSEKQPPIQHFENKEALLSHTETHIYELLGHGKTNKQIAEVVRIKENTVKTHRRNIASKLGIHGPELLVHAAQYVKKFQNKISPLRDGHWS